MLKRCFSGALAMLLACTFTHGKNITAHAEDIEIISTDIEATAGLADSTGVEGLTVDFGEWELVEEIPLQEIAELSGSPLQLLGVEYAQLIEGSAVLCEDSQLQLAIAEISGAPVLIVDRPASQSYQVAFNTQEGIMTGYVAASALQLMDQAETVAFLDALANSDTVALYEDDLDRPLAMLTLEYLLSPEPTLALEAQGADEGTEIIAEDIEGEPEGVQADRDADEESTYMHEAREAGFLLTQRDARLLVGETFTLGATEFDGAAIDTTSLTFASSDSHIVSVDAGGVVRALAPGSASIAVTRDGRSLAAEIIIPAEPTSISLNYSNGYVGLRESYSGLIVTMSPEGADASVTWSTSNANYVAVDSVTGTLTGVRLGSATITARTRNGKTASCKVTVKNAPSWISLPNTMTIAAQQSPTRISVSRTSGSACSDIRWTSSDESIARVDGAGMLTGIRAGRATITAETYNGKSAQCQVTVEAAPETLTLNHSSVVMDVNDSLTLRATLAPSGAHAEYSFRSSDTDVATVNSNGQVIARKAGTATITVETYNGILAQCAVQVYAAPRSVSLPATLDLGSGMQYRLTPTLSPEGANPTVTWSSSDTRVVTVADGLLSAVSAGSAVVTVRTANGKTANCRITVKAAPTRVSLSPTSVQLSGGGMRFQLNGSVPSGSAGSITYTSSNPGVARVDANGLITTGNAGTATITASTYNGKTATCAVTVSARPASASFASTEMTITTNQTVTPEVRVLAANGRATTADLTFAVDENLSQNPDAVSIDGETGAITGRNVGVAVINVTTHNGVAAQTPLTVTVKVDPTSISLSQTALTAGVGERVTLSPTLQPEGSVQNLTWVSSRPTVATVDAQGNVTAVGVGSTTITVRTHNGRQATCVVTVKSAPTSVSISPSTGSLRTGATGQYEVTFPAGTGGGYTFSTSDPLVATVSKTGRVSAITAGRVSIIVTTYNGLTASATLVVTGDSSAFPESMVRYGIASYQTTYDESMSNAEKLEYMIFRAQGKLGKKYVWGSFGPDQFDCSGYAYWCFQQIGISLKQSAYSQGYDNSQMKIESINDLRRGDLVFFNTDNDGDLSDHSGIYLGDGYFIHASSSAGKVIVSTLYGAGTYYNRNFSWGRRVLH